MLYRSHRGCLYYAPENTLPAFKMPLERGFDHIEPLYILITVTDFPSTLNKFTVCSVPFDLPSKRQ